MNHSPNDNGFLTVIKYFNDSFDHCHPQGTAEHSLGNAVIVAWFEKCPLKFWFCSKQWYTIMLGSHVDGKNIKWYLAQCAVKSSD